MSARANQEKPLTKEEVNPLCQSRFKPRSIDTAKKVHLPRLQHKNANHQYILIGDSMFERYLTTGSGKSLNPYDENELQKNTEPKDLWMKYHRMKAINLGVGGDNISNVLYRMFNVNCIGSCPEKPKKIVIWVGTNDIEYYKDDVVLNGILNLVDKVKSAYKKDIGTVPEIGVVGLLPRFSRSKKITVSDLNRSIQNLNYSLALHAKETKEFEFLDVYFDFYDDYKIKTEYYDDHVHLNNEGYQVFDKKFFTFLTGMPYTETSQSDEDTSESTTKLETETENKSS
jgi:lysophospholipase L1-like esterase